MSFNIRYASAEDGENHWEHRRALALERIHTFGPDLLGVQECQDGDQADFMKDNLRGYGFAGVRRGGEEYLLGKIIYHVALEMAAVFYRETAFSLLGQETFWLSRTPDVPGSKSWGSMFPRTVTWVRLRSKLPPFSEIYIFNAHFDHFSRKARLEGARLLVHRMLAMGDIPVILAGDFNALKDYSVYKVFVDAGLRDAYRQLHTPGRVKEGSFHDFGRIPPMAIDWIFVSKHFEVVQSEIDRFHTKIYPSDHYPITAILSLS